MAPCFSGGLCFVHWIYEKSAFRTVGSTLDYESPKHEGVSSRMYISPTQRPTSSCQKLLEQPECYLEVQISEGLPCTWKASSPQLRATLCSGNSGPSFWAPGLSRSGLHRILVRSPHDPRALSCAVAWKTLLTAQG